jgi:hypothetical protein
MSVAIGSSPANRSSRISRSGRYTSAAASWTRCWLPCRAPPLARPRGRQAPADQAMSGRPLVPRRATRRAAPRTTRASRLGQPQLRIEAALLGHVADPLACLRIDRPTVPRNAPDIGREQPGDDPFRGRLTGAVATAEREQASGRNREADPVDRDNVPEGPTTTQRASRRSGLRADHYAKTTPGPRVRLVLAQPVRAELARRAGLWGVRAGSRTAFR